MFREQGTASGQGTFPVGINAFGFISGYYIDAKNVSTHSCADQMAVSRFSMRRARLT